MGNEIGQDRHTIVYGWKKPKINYRLVGRNGETLYGTLQGFETPAGMKKNLIAVATALCEPSVLTKRIEVRWLKDRKSKIVIKKENWWV